MPKEIDSMTPVIVTWNDCYGDTAAQYESPELMLDGFKPAIRKTHGFFVGYAEKDGIEALVIAIDDDRSTDSPKAVGGPVYIPTGMVIRTEVLQRPAPVKRRRRKK